MITSKKRFIALTLSLLMVILSFPANVFAKTSDLGTSNDTVSDEDEFVFDTAEIIENTPLIKTTEIEELREENVKHFMLEDGTYKAVVYAVPVHRKDKDGVWQEIDNSLSLANVRGEQSISTPDNRIEFSKSFEPNAQIFSLNENGYSISISLLEDTALGRESATSQKVAQSAPTINNYINTINTEADSAETAFTAKNKSSVLYNGIKTNIDVEYVLYGNDIRENIIINSPCEDYNLAFQFQLSGLSANLDASGNVVIFDLQTTEPKYIIPAPAMYDNAGERSEGVYYQLQQQKDNKYLLKIVTNEEWLNSNARSYPVVIEQSIVTTSAVYDTYTFSSFPDLVLGYDPDLWVSNDHTTYIRMGLPKLPDGATFNTAQLYVSYYSTATSGSMLAGAYQILSYWDEEMTYNDSPQISNTRLSTAIFYASTADTESTPNETYFDITTAAQSWYNLTASKYGIAIKREASSVHTNTHTILKAYEAYDNDCAYICVNYMHYIPDGVYAIKKYNASTWMTIENDSTTPGSNVQKEGSGTSPADSDVFDKSSLFKISRVDGTNRYIIRLMLDNSLSFGISGNEIITKNIPCSDAEVNITDTFVFEWDGHGFLIRPYGSSKVITISSSSDNLSAIYKNNASHDARWNFVKYTGANRSGIRVGRPSSFDVGTVVTMTLKTWSTYIDYNTPYLVLAPESEYYATLSWNDSEFEGNIALHQAGEICVYSRICDANLTSKVQFSNTYNSELVVDESIYYIKNKEISKYIQADNNDAPDYGTQGASIELWDFNGNDYQQWYLLHIADGYYKIFSIKSGLVLSVQSNHLNNEGYSLVQEQYSNASRQQWKITKSSSDNFVLRPKSAEAYETDWCMSTDSQNVKHNAYLDNDVYYDEWLLIEFSRNMRLEPQKQTKWCWAACARMSSFNYTESNVSQSSAAVFIKLGIETPNPILDQITSANLGASVEETERTIEYILDTNNCYSSFRNIYDEVTLRSLLDCSNPVILSRGWYNSNGERNGGHCTIIYDYYWDSSRNIYMYKIFDPWDVNVGETYERSYQSIRDGRNPAFTGDIIDTGKWDGIIVYMNGDYQNTIPWNTP